MILNAARCVIGDHLHVKSVHLVSHFLATLFEIRAFHALMLLMVHVLTVLLLAMNACIAMKVTLDVTEVNAFCAPKNLINAIFVRGTRMNVSSVQKDKLCFLLAIALTAVTLVQFVEFVHELTFRVLRVLMVTH